MRERFIVILLLLVGLLIRVVELDSIPPGLWSDEANHGLEANEILKGGRTPLFFPGNCGQEPIFKYLVAGMTAIRGPGVVTLRLVSGIVGWLLLPLTWLWVRRVFGSRIALWTLFLLTVGVWHLHFSRMAFRAILGPTVGMAALLCVEWFRERRHLIIVFLAALLSGLLWYTYPAFRLFSFVVFLWFFIRIDQDRRKMRLWFVYGLGLFFILLPLILSWKNQPELFTARASMAALWKESPDVIAGGIRNVLRHLGMFNIAGDRNWRHNLSGEPQLDILTGFLFLIGIGVAMGSRSWKGWFTLIWLIVMLLPGILSVERQAPHCLRTLGVLPVPYLLAAFGIVWIRDRFISLSKGILIPLALIICIMTLNMTRYFIAWPQALSTLAPEKESLFGFHRQEHALARWLTDQKDREETTWLSPQLFLHPTVAYLTESDTYRLLGSVHDPAEGDLVVLDLCERNLWWLRDDFRKNFFLWWFETGRCTEGDAWSALLEAYPDCGSGLADASDFALAERLGNCRGLSYTGDVNGITLARMNSDSLTYSCDDPWPIEQWQRIPPGCFSVRIDSLPPSVRTVRLMAREEATKNTWQLDRVLISRDMYSATLDGCLLFPACVRIELIDPTEVVPDIHGSWQFISPPDPEPYFRNSLVYQLRRFWARIR